MRRECPKPEHAIPINEGANMLQYTGSLCAIRFLECIRTHSGNDRHGVLEEMVAGDGIEPPARAFSGLRPREVGVTSESQNNPVSTNGVNSAMTQSVRILRKIKKT